MRYGLIGEKLGHSFSKIIHEQLADYTYNLIPLSKASFHNFMAQKDFAAINVTIPYKEMVIPYLDCIDPKAEAIGAVNTIVNKNNRLYGYNTDYDGFRYMLVKHKIDPRGKKVLLLGKGGAAKACISVVTDMGAKEVLTVYYKENPETISYDACYQNHGDAQIIINTTPVGMFPNTEHSPIDLSSFERLEAVIDVVYNPLRTQFVLDGISKGVVAVGGLEMLIGQAKCAVAIFLEKKVDDSITHRLYSSLLEERSNLVLIGMSGCGKTTLGKKAAECLGKTFIDIDEEIVKEIKMPIEDYFYQMGEPAFREIEKAMVQKYSQLNGFVISTGGGVIKDWENINILKKNGRIVWIKREVSLLESGNGRPLAPNAETTLRLYQERLPLYTAAAEGICENNFSPETGLDELILVFAQILSKA
ncbi:shikimate dehydrogenase [Anaerotignum neopropionicum]|uniref:Shikimate kinase n=1 Tax=Anaerotignum neopropionicum TaxID=36847 RepID=A0A136WFS9_9FIRM|nr:shikimate kinase [Anaerotignum neopropionicum]KXL53412.1 shikimate dehydrogenase [Anaerotignum neopropionicum]